MYYIGIKNGNNPDISTWVPRYVAILALETEEVLMLQPITYNSSPVIFQVSKNTMIHSVEQEEIRFITDEEWYSKYKSEMLRIHGDGKLFESPTGFSNIRLSSKCPPILCTVEEDNGETYECTLDELLEKSRKEQEEQAKGLKQKHQERKADIKRR